MDQQMYQQLLTRYPGFIGMHNRMDELLTSIRYLETETESGRDIGEVLPEFIDAYNELITICTRLAGIYNEVGYTDERENMTEMVKSARFAHTALVHDVAAAPALAHDADAPALAHDAATGDIITTDSDVLHNFNQLKNSSVENVIFFDEDEEEPHDEQQLLLPQQQPQNKGSGICKHGRRKTRCKDCGGGSICEHGKLRNSCRDCGGGSICQHGRIKTTCKDCGGSGICVHGRQRRQCKECLGPGICKHDKQKSQCRECGGSNICQHDRRRVTCKECGGTSFCIHGRIKYTCKECRGVSICEHNRVRRNCKECGGSGICEHGKRKNICKECKQKGGKTRKSKKSYRNVKMSFRKNKKVVAHKKTKRLLKSSSKATL